MQSMRGVNMRKIIIFTITLSISLIAVLLSTIDQSDAFIQIYDAKELSNRDSQYRDYITAVFREDLIGQLPLQERAALSNTRIVLPRGVIETSPIAVWASVQERTIYFPIQTIAFLDDIAALAAWLSKNNCSFEPAALYAGMIASKAPPSNQMLHLNPRSAFGLGDDVWNDPYVKKSSNQVFKTAVYFILAHELGHIQYNHLGNNTISDERSQAQELQADRFAIDAMRHVGVPPVGMLHFFTILSRMEGYVPTTHPLSGSRMIQIASALENFPGDFVPPNENKSRWKPIIREYGHKFRTLIPVMDDPALRRQLSTQARFAAWSELRKKCHK